MLSYMTQHLLSKLFVMCWSTDDAENSNGNIPAESYPSSSSYSYLEYNFFLGLYPIISQHMANIENMCIIYTHNEDHNKN